MWVESLFAEGPIAYSRREAFGDDGADGAAVVIFGEMGDEVGGGEVAAVGLNPNAEVARE